MSDDSTAPTSKPTGDDSREGSSVLSLSGGIFGPSRRGLTAGILLSIVAFAAEGMGVVPALPTVVRDLGGMSLFGWAFSAFMLAWLLGTVVGGQLADARGPGRPMALGLCAFASGLLVASAASKMPLFLVGRSLQGAGGGAMIASAYVAIARGYPDSLRPRMFALTSSAWVLPAVLGPALSGTVVEHTSWRFVFVGVVPLIALTALVVLPPLRPLAVQRPFGGTKRIGSAVRLAVGAGLVLAAPTFTTWGLWGGIGCGVLGALMLGPALLALLPRGTLRVQRGLPAGIATRGILAFGYFGTEAFVPLGASELRGATPSQAGLVLTAASIGWISASWVQDRQERVAGPSGRGRRVRGGFVMVLLGILIIGLGLHTSLPFAVVALGCLIAGAGIGAAYGAGGLLCIAAAPEGQEGEVSAQLQLMEALCTAAATGLGGALFAFVARHGHGPREAHAAVLGFTALATLLGVVLAGRLTAPQNTQ